MRTPASRKPARRAQGPPCPAQPRMADHSRWVGPARPVSPSGNSAPFPPYQFSSISLIALAGRWITSPAAMRFTTVSSRRRITPATNAMSAPRLAVSQSLRLLTFPPASADAVLTAFSATIDDWATRMPVKLLFDTSVPGSLSRPQRRPPTGLEGHALARQSSRTALPIGSLPRAKGIRNLQPIGTEVPWRRLVRPGSGDLAQTPGGAWRSAGSSPFAAASELGVLVWPSAECG